MEVNTNCFKIELVTDYGILFVVLCILPFDVYVTVRDTIYLMIC